MMCSKICFSILLICTFGFWLGKNYIRMQSIEVRIEFKNELKITTLLKSALKEEVFMIDYAIQKIIFLC